MMRIAERRGVAHVAQLSNADFDVNSVEIEVGEHAMLAISAKPESFMPHFPCVVCGAQDRWNDHGVWRCRQCWPEPLTQAARRVEEREQARLAVKSQAQRPSASRPKPRDPRLGPLLPPCPACGELQHWRDHDAKTWRCWTCAPPALRDAA
jgi:hypothetical protein